MFGFACIICEGMDDDFVSRIECDRDWVWVIVFGVFLIADGVACCW